MRTLSLIVAALVIVGPLAAQPKPADPKKPEPKRVSFAFQNKPWNDVFNWLTHASGLSVIAVQDVKGTFTFAGPAGKTYTIPEVIAILNEALENQDYGLNMLQEKVILLQRKLKPVTIPIETPPPAERRPALVTELIPLTTAQAVRVVETLREMFAGPPRLYLEADLERNAIIVRATPEQIAEIKAVLPMLGETPAAGNVRTVNLDRGSAADLAEAIQRALRDMNPKTPVRVVNPTRDDPKAKQPPPAGDKALTLAAVGNRLIATGDDPQALAMVVELARLLTQARNDGDFVVHRLRSRNAAEVARVLSETFNGPADPRRAERVRIVADPATNALLIRAAPLDYVTVKKLLERLDSDHDDAMAEVKTFVIGPLKHASAAELARVIKEVYRNEGGRAGFTVTADPRTNSLILRGAATLFEDAQRLVVQLDTPAPEKGK